MAIDADPRYPLLITEYEQLRAEINNRTRLQMNLVIAALTTLGVGMSIVDTFPHNLVGVAAIISVLAFLWSDHDKQINTVGAYIALRLEPAMRPASGGFEWEPFFRGIDAGGKSAAEQLCRSPNDDFWGRATEMPPEGRIIEEYALLFYAVPFVLLATYGGILANDVASDRLDATGCVLRSGSLVTASVILWWSWKRWRDRKKRREIIKQRILRTPRTPA
ncbi:MAG TPA: hypothetical protein VHI71_05920 [Actinomycetota bacterium]|nr:hypothetical protein [Actinomycetota bacterium]